MEGKLALNFEIEEKFDGKLLVLLYYVLLQVSSEILGNNYIVLK